MGQDCPDLEMIIADANSKDNTREIAKFYGCRVVEGGLPAAGRNNGARVARGDILIFADSDTIWPDNFLILAIAEFEKRRLDVAGTLQTPIRNGYIIKDIENKFYYELANFFMKLMENSRRPFMQVCMFVRKEVHETIGGFDESIWFGEDFEYAVRAVHRGYRFGILDNEKIQLSSRRFEKEGFLLAFKYLYYNLARFFGHEFRGEDKYHNK